MAQYRYIYIYISEYIYILEIYIYIGRIGIIILQIGTHTFSNIIFL